MCGLSAIVDFGAGGDLAERLLAMHGRIRHRGPDGEGFCLLDGRWNLHDARDAAQLRAAAAGPAPRAGFAFRWLQIQDRSSAAAQPMASPDGQVRLMFNGEIYNFRELRAELEGLGHVFHSRADTEVVLCAWRQWDVGMFDRLDGMWAIVLLDLAGKRLLISRDRFGIKPLFHRYDGRSLLVASEVKQLLAAGVQPQANLPAIKRFIRGGRPAVPEQSFFDAIASQPAATYCAIDLRAAPDKLLFQPYWTLAARVHEDQSLDAACGRLDELLVRAVDTHMISEAPAGILVSGGLDSSIVAAMSAPGFARRGETGTGFSMVLGPGESALDERPLIDRVVAANRFRGLTIEFRPDWLKAHIDDVTRAQEEPVAGMAVAGQYLTFQLAGSTGTRVVLDGQGADELFGGYPRHQFALLGDQLRSGAWMSLASEAGALAARDRGFLREAWRTSVARRAGGESPVDFIREEERDAAGPRLTLDETLRRDVLVGNLRAVLAVTDRNAMAHEIEARVPYVSRGVVEFAFTLPDRFKVGGGERKRVLRRVGARHLPAQIVNRKDRIGFGAPVHSWLMRHFEPELRALPDGSAYGDCSALDRARLRRFIDAFLAGAHRDAGTMWRLYAIDRWAATHSVTGL